MMTRDELETRLQENLTFCGLSRPKYAVVLPVVWQEDGLNILLEVRAEGISQAGDPCMPGGRIEPGETPAEAAVREMQEELGISVPAERLLGQLPTVQTILGSQADVFVCTISREDAKQAVWNPDEVAEVLDIPLRFFEKSPDSGSFLYHGHRIWGMTAGTIRNFCRVWQRIQGE